MRSHGDPKADVFRAAMLMWEMAAGKSPQHPSVQTHIPVYAKQQLPPALMRTSGFSSRVNFAAHEPFRPDLEALPWKPFRALVAHGWHPLAEKRASAAQLLEKLQTLPGRWVLCATAVLYALRGEGYCLQQERQHTIVPTIVPRHGSPSWCRNCLITCKVVVLFPAHDLTAPSPQRRPQESVDPAPDAGSSSDSIPTVRKYPCATCAVQ